jgi:hypothetical protein
MFAWQNRQSFSLPPAALLSLRSEVHGLQPSVQTFQFVVLSELKLVISFPPTYCRLLVESGKT